MEVLQYRQIIHNSLESNSGRAGERTGSQLLGHGRLQEFIFDFIYLTLTEYQREGVHIRTTKCFYQPK